MNPQPLVVYFTKMHGIGNDFIVIDNRFFHLTEDELAGLARRYCPRRIGVGADGLLALEDSTIDGVHFRMRYWNADGSLGTMCGNGARCLARFAAAAGIEGNPLVFETDGGRYSAVLAEGGGVRLSVPPAKDFGEVAPQRAKLDGPTYRIWTGTEHAVRFVDDVASASVSVEGPALRRDLVFAPTGANVNFVEVLDADAACIRVRTYEKGVEEETLGCGTGALAAAVASRLTGRVHAGDISVKMQGGTLRVRFSLPEGATWAEDAADLSLEGPAQVVYQGTLELP